MEEAEEKDYPSIWDWPELKEFEKRHWLHRVKFDQGATGHVRRKPTTLCTSMEEIRQLHGLKDTDEPREEIKEGLQERLAQSSSWAAWSPGLVAAVKVSIEMFLGGRPSCRRFTLDEWRAHVRQGHVPYRKDCRACIEEMGQDRPHRRRKSSEAGETAYALSMDVIGPYKPGWDFARSATAKYALVTTIPVPISDIKEDLPGYLQDLEEEEGEKDALEELLDDEEIEATEAEKAEEEVARGAADARRVHEEPRGEVENDEEKAERKEEAEKPMKMQLLTMLEPLESRQSGEIVKALERVWAN